MVEVMVIMMVVDGDGGDVGGDYDGSDSDDDSG